MENKSKQFFEDENGNLIDKIKEAEYIFAKRLLDDLILPSWSEESYKRLKNTYLQGRVGFETWRRYIRENPERIEDKKELENFENNIIKQIDELWRDEHGISYATIINNYHKENLKIYSRNFKNFITKIIYEDSNKVPNSNQIKSLQDIFSAKAQFEGEQHQTYLRCARFENVIYIDLCRQDWRILEITESDIRIVESNIKFKRFNHMKELLFDKNSEKEDLNLILKYCKIENERDKLLFKCDCILQIIPDIPRAIDIYFGSPGSSKTNSMKTKKKIIDPSSMDSLSLPKDKNELIQQLSHHYICAYDNIRRINNEFSDLFCRVVTGDSFSKRELYTDDEDIIYSLKRKLMFNGINVCGEEPDFLDRSITYELSRIPKKERKKESILISEFEKDQPKITGATFKILQKTLSKIKEIEIKELPRMADYCFWGEAVSQVFGENPKAFTINYFDKIGNLSKEALEANPVGLSLLEFLKENNEFEGTASDLLGKLKQKAEELKINLKYFPNAPNSLTRRINEIKANLEEEGIKIEYDARGKQRKIIIFSKNIVENVDIVDEGSLSSVNDVNDIFNDISKKNENIVENQKISTIGTIKNDTSKNIVEKTLSSVNDVNNIEVNDIDDTYRNDNKIGVKND